MKNRVLIDPSILTDIADAIREKTGSTGTIKPSEMADEIEDISTGVSVDNSYTVTFSEDNEVKECHIVQQGLSVPSPSYVPTVSPYKWVLDNNRVTFPYTPTSDANIIALEDETYTSRLIAKSGVTGKPYIAIVRNYEGTEVRLVFMTTTTQPTTDGYGRRSFSWSATTPYFSFNTTVSGMYNILDYLLDDSTVFGTITSQVGSWTSIPVYGNYSNSNLSGTFE